MQSLTIRLRARGICSHQTRPLQASAETHLSMRGDLETKLLGADHRHVLCLREEETHPTPHTSHLTPHTAHSTPHTSHLTPHTSHRTPHTSHLTPHTSHLTPHTSHLTPHTSHLTPHTSHLTPHTSHLEPHKSRVKRHKSPARGLVCLQTPHTHWSRLNAAHTDRPALVQHHR